MLEFNAPHVFELNVSVRRRRRRRNRRGRRRNGSHHHCLGRLILCKFGNLAAAVGGAWRTARCSFSRETRATPVLISKDYHLRAGRGKRALVQLCDGVPTSDGGGATNVIHSFRFVAKAHTKSTANPTPRFAHRIDDESDTAVFFEPDIAALFGYCCPGLGARRHDDLLRLAARSLHRAWQLHPAETVQPAADLHKTGGQHPPTH
eukprot:SAG11_NODE_3129_length_2665_cov_1.658613_2_plen_205_part_00